MATEQQTAVTKAGLDESLETNFNDMQGYADTAVDTLTAEVDRQFREFREHMDTKFAEVLKAIKG